MINNINRHEARNIAKKLIPMLTNMLESRIMKTESSKLKEYEEAEKQYQEAYNRRQNALSDIFDSVMR